MAKQTTSTVAKQDGTSPLAMLAKQPMAVLENFQGTSPWLQFSHTQTKNFMQMTAALGQLKNGTPVFCGLNEFVKLDPVTFIATSLYHQGYGVFDAQGNIVDYMDADGTKPPASWREIISALIIVDVKGELRPCRCEFRTAKCKGFKSATSEIDKVSQPQWKDETRENKAIYTLAQKHKIPDWALVTHTGTCTHVPKQAPDFPYDVFNTTSSTITPAMLNSLAVAQKEDSFNQVIKDCMTDLEKRIASFRAPKRAA